MLAVIFCQQNPVPRVHCRHLPLVMVVVGPVVVILVVGLVVGLVAVDTIMPPTFLTKMYRVSTHPQS